MSWSKIFFEPFVASFKYIFLVYTVIPGASTGTFHTIRTRITISRVKPHSVELDKVSGIVFSRIEMQIEYIE